MKTIRKKTNKWLRTVSKQPEVLNCKQNSINYRKFCDKQAFHPWTLKHFKKFTKLIRFNNPENIEGLEYAKAKKEFFNSFKDEDIFSKNVDKLDFVDTIYIFKNEIDKQLILRAREALQQYAKGVRGSFVYKTLEEVPDARS